MSIPRIAAIGLTLVIGTLGAMAWVDSCRKHDGQASEIQSAIHQGEAQAHAQTAQSIPDHAAEIQSAKDDVARARSEVARLKRIVAAQQGHAVSDPAGPGETLPPVVDPDPRDSVIASQGVLIQAQDGQIEALTLALADEQKRSGEWKAAFESERKARQAQEVATKAWKSAVSTSKWKGRVEGFAAGVALGYLGGRR